MLRFIIQTLIMLSLGAMLYLMAKALPRVEDENQDAVRMSQSKIMAYVERFDEIFKVSLEKALRRLRVWLLRLDNFISKKLNRFKKNGTREAKPSLTSEEGKEEDKVEK